jgi:hypothetical protein
MTRTQQFSMDYPQPKKLYPGMAASFQVRPQRAPGPARAPRQLPCSFPAGCLAWEVWGMDSQGSRLPDVAGGRLWLGAAGWGPAGGLRGTRSLARSCRFCSGPPTSKCSTTPSSCSAMPALSACPSRRSCRWRRCRWAIACAARPLPAAACVTHPCSNRACTAAVAGSLLLLLLLLAPYLPAGPKQH